MYKTPEQSQVTSKSKSGFVVSEKTVTQALDRNVLDWEDTSLLQKRHLQARLKFSKDNLPSKTGDLLEAISWSDETKLLGIEMSPMFGENKGRPIMIILNTLFLQCNMVGEV